MNRFQSQRFGRSRRLGLACAVLVAGVAWAADRPNFSGDWALNMTKSHLETPGIKGGTVHIDHKDTSWRFDRVFDTDQGPEKDGYELVVGAPEKTTRNGAVTTRSKMYWEGNQLVLDEKSEFQGRIGTNVVHYRLEDGGKTLVAHEIFTTPRLHHDNLWIFDRSR